MIGKTIINSGSNKNQAIKFILSFMLLGVLCFGASMTTFAEETIIDPTQPDGVYLIEEDVYDENGSYLFRYEYVYDDNYLLTNKNEISKSGAVDDTYEYEYDSEGNLIKEIHISGDNSITIDEYMYDENNILIQKSYERDGEAINTEKYIYDDDGHLIQRIVHVISGNYDNVMTYDYDDEGHAIKQYSDDGGYVVNYAYDNDGNLAEQLTPEGSGSVWTYENGLKVDEHYYYQGELSYTANYVYEYTEDFQDSEVDNEQSTNDLNGQDTVKLVQEALNNAGYDCGTPDGIEGERTTEAISRYQEDHGMTVNGEISNELLASLNISRSEEETADTGNDQSEESPFVAQGNTGLMSFLSAATDNGYPITNPDNKGDYVSAEARGSDATYSIDYWVTDQHVFGVYIYLGNSNSADSESFKNCVAGLTKSLNSDIDDNILTDSINKAIENPDERIIESDTLFLYRSEDRKFVVTY